MGIRLGQDGEVMIDINIAGIRMQFFPHLYRVLVLHPMY